MGGVAENKVFAGSHSGITAFTQQFHSQNNNYYTDEFTVWDYRAGAQMLPSRYGLPQYLLYKNGNLSDVSYQVNDKTGKVVVFVPDPSNPNRQIPSAMLLDNGNQLEDIKDSINVLTTAVRSIPTTITASASSSSSGGGTAVIETDDTPMVSVTVNTNFDVPLSVYDDIASGTSSDGKVQVVNSTVGDKLIHLKGKLTSVGIFQYKINGRTFNIKVIENPTATNVVVRLE